MMLYVVQVDGELWDLDRPLEGNCSLQLLKFDDEKGHLQILCGFSYKDPT